MGDGPQNSEQPIPQPKKPRFLGWLTYRKPTEPGIPGAYVGEVNPKEPFFQQGVKDTGGMIVTGEERDDVGIAYIPEAKRDAGKPPEKTS